MNKFAKSVVFAASFVFSSVAYSTSLLDCNDEGVKNAVYDVYDKHPDSIQGGLRQTDKEFNQGGMPTAYGELAYNGHFRLFIDDDTLHQFSKTNDGVDYKECNVMIAVSIEHPLMPIGAQLAGASEITYIILADDTGKQMIRLVSVKSSKFDQDYLNNFIKVWAADYKAKQR